MKSYKNYCKNAPKNNFSTTYVQKVTPTAYIFLFFTISFAGFIWEVLLHFVLHGHFFNRGFFYGPWLPVYGTGAVFILLLLHKKRNRPVFCFGFSALIGAVTELCTGWFLHTVFHMRYWDYTNQLLNVNGYICLYSVLGFALAGMIFTCYGAPFLLRFWNRITPKVRHRILSVLLLLLLIDTAVSLLVPNSGKGITY